MLTTFRTATRQSTTSPTSVLTRFFAGPSSVIHIVGSVFVVLLVSCGGSTPEPMSAAGLPPYTRSEGRVFDDSFAPEIFSLPSDRSSPLEDLMIIERTQRADFGQRAKAITVSRDRRGSALTYQLVLRPLGPPIFGNVHENLELTLKEGNPSIALVEREGASLVGQVVIVLGRFYNEKGTVAVHFRIEPDKEQVLLSIKRARFIDNAER